MGTGTINWHQAAREIDLTQVVKSYGVGLEKQGSLYAACCPFHPEKTPSFKVFPDGHWYCWGACKEGGNALTFVMRMEGCGRSAALAKLSAFTRSHSSIDGADDDVLANLAYRDTLYQLNGIAARYFHQMLDSLNMRRLFHARGVTDESIDKFMLGYAPPRGIVEVFADQPICVDSLKHSGLVTHGDAPFFRNRLIIPYFDYRERAVGFSGRAITKEDESGAKYINTPTTEVFSKRLQLYLWREAQKSIRELGFAIIVEGQIDGIMLHQNEIANAIAISGTALTSEHAYALKNVPEVIVTLDGDLAGVKAALHSIGNLTREGINVRIGILPQEEGTGKGFDPDSYVRAKGRYAFLKVVGSAKPYFEAYNEFLNGRFDRKTQRGKMQIGRELVYAVHLTANPFERAMYIDFISSEFGISRDALTTSLLEIGQKEKARLRKLQRKDYRINNLPPDTIEELVSGLRLESPSVGVERDVIAHLLFSPEIPKGVIRQIKPELFSDPDYRHCAELRLKQKSYTGTSEQLEAIKTALIDGQINNTSLMAMLERGSMPADVHELDGAVSFLHEERRQERLKRLSNEIVLTSDSDPRRAELLGELRDILKDRK